MPEVTNSRVLVVALFAPYTVDLVPSTSDPASATAAALAHPVVRHQRSSSLRRASIRPRERLPVLSAEAQLKPTRPFNLRENGVNRIGDLAGGAHSHRPTQRNSPPLPPRAEPPGSILTRTQSNGPDGITSASQVGVPINGPAGDLDTTAALFGNNAAFGPDMSIPPLELEKPLDPTSLCFTKPRAPRVSFAPNEKPDGSALNTPQARPVQAPVLEKSHSFTKDPAPFEVAPLNVGNIGLFNAINASPRTATNRLFVGTLGIETDDWDRATRHAVSDTLYRRYDTFPVYTTSKEIDGHYNQFCKQALWPMFHYMLPEYPTSMGWEHDAWEACLAVHRRFAEAIVEVYQENDIIWVNDYHLILLPAMLRQRLPNAKIGFFLHVPFPSSEIFRCLHVRKEILRGLVRADLIGFQTFSFARHFTHTCSRILSYETSPKGIHLPNSDVAVGIYPIGIDPEVLKAKKNQPQVQEMAQFLREKYAGKKVIIGRDKLDHVKGVRQKLLAFENFLVRYPEWRGRVVLIQIALSTAEHNEIQSHVSDVVARINSRFGSISYQPVVFLHQDIPFDQYLALLTFADVFINTSLRDGMNLTSHEYIICQEQTHNPLIISEFAGTYGLLGVAAIRVNPWDVTETAEAMLEALTMGQEERSVRWSELYRHVTTTTSRSWVDGFLTDVEKAHGDIYTRYDKALPRLDESTIYQQLLPTYLSATHRLFLLNYDGVLVPYQATPNATVLVTPALRDCLCRLTADPRNLVYILSGRTKASLETQLAGIPHLGLMAEHGCFTKPPSWSLASDSDTGAAESVENSSAGWEDYVQSSDLTWHEPVMEILEYYLERTPGSWIEKKDVAVVWHYYNCENPSYGAWQAGECQNHIEDSLAPTYPIHVIRGSKCIEVTLKGMTAATAVQRILDHPRWNNTTGTTSMTPTSESPATPTTGSSTVAADFCLALGNDRPDEDMFKVLAGGPRPSLTHHHHSSSSSSSVSALMSPTATAPSGITTSEVPEVPTKSHLFTCSVGAPFVKAQYFIPNTTQVLECLEAIAKTSEERLA